MNDQAKPTPDLDTTIAQKPEIQLGDIPSGVKGLELHQLLVDAANGKGISPDKIEMFGTVPQVPLPEQKSSVPSIGTAKLAAGCLGGYFITNALIAAFPELHSIPLLDTEIPVRLNDAFNAIISFTSDSMAGKDISSAIPFLLKYAAIVSGSGFMGDFVGKLFSNTKLNAQIEQTKQYNANLGTAHQELNRKVEKQELQMKMKPGHTAAFTGNGDPTLERIRAKLGIDEAMEYTNKVTHNTLEDFLPTELLPETASPDELSRVLDNGDFKSAGEVFISPVNADETFLAHLPEDFDMDPVHIEKLIDQLDLYCTSKGIDKKRIVIAVNPLSMEVNSQTIIKGEKISTTMNLQQMIDAKVAERSTPIDVINPDTLVMQRLLSIAKGKRLGFHAFAEGVDKYSERFEKVKADEITKSGYQTTVDDDLIVIYNVSDDPTVIDAKLPPEIRGKEKVAVITDPTRKPILLARGYTEDHIVVVPELLRDQIILELQKS